MTVQVTPAMLAGINRPGEGKPVSPEAADIVARIRDHYRGLGKGSAAHNYSRHLKSFFSWAEGAGYSIRNLPIDAVESFLASLAAAGQKETTLYVMRTQLKSALREVHNALGVDMSHLEYQTGKPPEVRQAQKAKEKKARAEKRLAQTAAQLSAIQAAQATLFNLPPQGEQPSDQLAASPDDLSAIPPTEYPMSDQSAPQAAGQAAAGAAPAAQSQNPVVVVQMPAQNTRPTASVLSNGAAQPTGARAVQPTRGLVINTLMFTGPYIKISYISDGSNPLSPPGTEIALQLLPTSQVAPHGDLATYLQQFVIPKMRLGPLTSQIQFVFHELNEKRQPTGRKDEMVVSVPLSASSMDQAQVLPAQSVGPMGGQPTMLPYGMPVPSGGMDEATRFLLTKLDREAEEAKKHAAEVQDQMRKASDTTSMMMLMQQFQRAEDVRREAEARRDAEAMRAMQQAQFAGMPAPTPVPVPLPPPPEPTVNVAAELAKANAESNKSMMEMMVAVLTRPQPAPPPPPVQKDVSEWLVPFMAQMNQQAMQMQQANQQLLVGVMQSMMNREDPTLKFLVQQMQEVKAAAASPKVDEMESFADKLQKMRMVSDMLGGNSGPNVLSELLANADTIGAGAAKVIAAAKAGKEPQIPQVPVRQSVSGAPQLPASTTTPTGTQQAPQSNEQPVAAPPPEALAQLQSVVQGVNADDDQMIVNSVIELIKALLNAPEPYPVIGRRMLVTLKSADDSADLMILVKNLWTQLGQQVDRPAAKVVTKTLAKWYSVIHQQVFGEPRSLPENDDEQPGQTVNDEQDDQDGDEGEEEADETGPEPRIAAGA